VRCGPWSRVRLPLVLILILNLILPRINNEGMTVMDERAAMIPTFPCSHIPIFRVFPPPAQLGSWLCSVVDALLSFRFRSCSGGGEGVGWLVGWLVGCYLCKQTNCVPWSCNVLFRYIRVPFKSTCGWAVEGSDGYTVMDGFQFFLGALTRRAEGRKLEAICGT
jgi:hypothetical protein